MRPPLSLGAAVLAAGLALPSAAFSDALAPGTTLSATATPAGRVIALDAPARAYVQGRFRPGGTEQALDLLGLGLAARPLARAADGTQAFHLVMPEGGALRVRGPEGSAFSLEISTVVPDTAQSSPAAALLSPRLEALAGDLAAGGTTEGFWAEMAQTGTPMVEPDPEGLILTFLYRGAARNVRLIGGPSNDHDWLKRLGRSDLWYRSYRVPRDLRLSYRLAADVPDLPGPARARRIALLATAAPDPLNPRLWPARADALQWSIFEGSEAPEQPGFPAADPAVEELRLRSAILGNTRRVQLFRSPGYTAGAPEALLLIVFDGPVAVGDWQLPGALETLVRAGRLPPLAALFIDPIDSEMRARELPPNPAFARFLAEELLPFATRDLGLRADPARTVLIGASYGGLAAADLAIAAPERFGAAIALSGSFWWRPEGTPEGALCWSAELALAAPHLPRLALSAGLYETARTEAGRPPPAGIRDSAHELLAVLRGRGAEAHWLSHAGGHDGFVWRGEATAGLLALFGR